MIKDMYPQLVLLKLRSRLHPAGRTFISPWKRLINISPSMIRSLPLELSPLLEAWQSFISSHPSPPLPSPLSLPLFIPFSFFLKTSFILLNGMFSFLLQTSLILNKRKLFFFNYFQIRKREGQQLISSPRKHDLCIQAIPMTVGIHNASDVSIHLSIACRSHKHLFLSSYHKGGSEKIPLKTLSRPGS